MKIIIIMKIVITIIVITKLTIIIIIGVFCPGAGT